MRFDPQADMGERENVRGKRRDPASKEHASPERVRPPRESAGYAHAKWYRPFDRTRTSAVGFLEKPRCNPIDRRALAGLPGRGLVRGRRRGSPQPVGWLAH